MTENEYRKFLKNLNIAKLKLDNGNTVEQELVKHAKILADCIAEQLFITYTGYTPKVYERTYGLLHSVYVGDKIHVDTKGNKLSISVDVAFDDGAVHQGFDGQNVNVARLLNDGWQTHGRFADVEYFGYRIGTHFMENAIEEYKHKVKNPLDVQINYL